MRELELGGLKVRLVGGEDREGGGDGPLVVLFHGFGAPGTDLVALHRVMDVTRRTRYAFPEAPNDLGPAYGHGRAWWLLDAAKLQQAMMTGVPRDLRDEDPEALGPLRDQVTEMLDGLTAELGPSHLVLGGFSQGAMLATEMTLSTERTIDGLVLWSGAYLAGPRWTAAMPDRVADLPVYQSHGNMDPLLSFEGAGALRDALSAAGAKITFQEFRGAHQIPSQVIDGTSAMLESIFD